MKNYMLIFDGGIAIFFHVCAISAIAIILQNERYSIQSTKEKRKMTLTRREVLSAVSIAAGSCALSSCAIEEMGASKEGIAKSAYPWKYAKLDPEKTAQRAYAECPKGHCMYGVFASVMSQLAEKYGEP